MSVVVAIKQGNKVYLGGDSFIGNRWKHNTLSPKNQKVFKAYDNNDIMIGVVGSFRDANIVATTEQWIDELTILKNNVDFKTIVRSVVKKLFDELKGNGREVKKTGAHMSWESEMLFIYKDDIYFISIDGSVEAIDDYMAIGAGEDLALGYLHQSKEENPKDRIYKAIESASKTSNYVAKPIIILESGKDDYEFLY